ncbi:hypothetical protein [Dyella humicola]|uniref:hypothetical protein n=1 Tax=Dyella humicola TaxID=2992126 RepID=UPI002257D709|nr:hypothetical protein [Dyella humicola]
MLKSLTPMCATPIEVLAMTTPHESIQRESRTDHQAIRPPSFSQRLFEGVKAPSLAAALAVLELAREIEPGFVLALKWYCEVPIKEFGDMTALQLVTQGDGAAVLAFLNAIYRGDRG